MVRRAHIDLLGVTILLDLNSAVPIQHMHRSDHGEVGEGRRFFQSFQTMDSRMHVCIRGTGCARSRLGPSPRRSLPGLP